MTSAGRLVARWVPAPVPYYLITVASIEAYEAMQQEKERDQSGN
jgi:hypothetical protein